MLATGILGSGRTRGVSFRPFPNSSGWWWLISSLLLIRISCNKTTQAKGYYGAWPGWVVSISVLPLIVLLVWSCLLPSQALLLPGWPISPLVGSFEPRPHLPSSRVCVTLSCPLREGQALPGNGDTNAVTWFGEVKLASRW